MPTPPLILIVADEQVDLEVASTILGEEGYRTLTASSVNDALQLLQSDKPDLIISDIAMPKMGGFQFYQKLQKMQGLGSVPFIFLSALSDREHVREGREMGADDYLTKPLDIDELVTTVKENLKHAASLRNSIQGEFETLKEQIIATLSHELNTPLTSIIGFSEIISSLTLSFHSAGAVVRLEVADTGVGILDVELPRVREKFYQVIRDKQEEQGADLGLYITNNLAKINHCELAISSAESVGTKVTLAIPTR